MITFISLYRALSLINTFSIKNKYLLFSCLIMALITFIFNKNISSFIVYFKDFNVYTSNINFKLIFIYVIITYLSYIKFNFIIKILSIFKSIPFFL
jgi:hypothetical protein